jgi:hypothetical protein
MWDDIGFSSPSPLLYLIPLAATFFLNAGVKWLYLLVVLSEVWPIHFLIRSPGTLFC